jgi:hypothetical protein
MHFHVAGLVIPYRVQLRHFRASRAGQVLRSDSNGIRRNITRLRGRARRAIGVNAQTKSRRQNDPPPASGFVANPRERGDMISMRALAAHATLKRRDARERSEFF